MGDVEAWGHGGGQVGLWGLCVSPREGAVCGVETWVGVWGTAWVEELGM